MMFVNGILLIYRHPLAPAANTILEHVGSFGQYSRFKFWSLNTELGFPQALRNLRFKGILLHYSLFDFKYALNNAFLNYLEQNRPSYKIAFFQDEHRFCKQRYDFLNQFKVDCVYTLIEPSFWKDTYLKYTKVKKIIHTLPGYVSDALIEGAAGNALPSERRKIDIGYRGRRLEFYMGKGSQEKYEIGVVFKEKAVELDLKLEIETEERKRLYGKAWYQFIGECKAVLGVEAGVSIFDVEDIVYQKYRQLIAANPKITFDEMSKKLLNKWEDRIPYRTISPRHFEAAAFRTCQILFEGNYSGILHPMIHYIPLKKDFSNFKDVIAMFHDQKLRSELTDNAYQDLIASGHYSYRKFISNSIDKMLIESSLQADISDEEVDIVTSFLMKDIYQRKVYANFRNLLYRPFPGRRFIAPLVRLMLRSCDKVKQWGLYIIKSNIICEKNEIVDSTGGDKNS
jgi:hypothetical protein